MEMNKSNYQHFRSDDITDHQLEEMGKILNANASLLSDMGRITNSQIIRNAIHHYYAEVTKGDTQDANVKLIRDQLSQILNPEINEIIDSLQRVSSKLND